jgi:hypothetical protein
MVIYKNNATEPTGSGRLDRPPGGQVALLDRFQPKTTRQVAFLEKLIELRLCFIPILDFVSSEIKLASRKSYGLRSPLW